MWNNEERTIAYKKAKALERIADNLEKVVELLTELKNGGNYERYEYKSVFSTAKSSNVGVC